MAKTKAKAKKNRTQASQTQKVEQAPTSNSMYAVRETIESIVIAFVLAFLFRTFEAEAFVIPTGSMSPSLQGQHKDVDCSECGYRFRTTASSEGDERLQRIAQRRPAHEIAGVDIVAGMCPMCRQTMLMRPDVSTDVPDYINSEDIPAETSYPGDRILVNKFAYTGRDPSRWDVVVFKFPGDGEMNYIKRLVGLPNETLRIYQGDLFVRDDALDRDFQIARKPADKVWHMLQPVHDTAYDSATLFNAGWPLRWHSNSGWQTETKVNDQTVEQTYRIDATASAKAPAWLRYQHYLPSDNDWAIARDYEKSNRHSGLSKEQWLTTAQPELITDFNPYNAHILRKQTYNGPWSIEPHQLGVEWVSDLAVKCQVDVQQTSGAIFLDLVEAGRHFTCRIDISSGEATFSIEGASQFKPTALTPVNKTGSYELLFANVDDQLLLWVDGNLIEVDGATYGEAEIGSRKKLLPQTDDTDQGDLAPVGIGAVGTKLAITRLEILRDIYYIAANHHDSQRNQMGYFTDYLHPGNSKLLDDGSRVRPLHNIRELFKNPETWNRFTTRQKREFTIDDNQLFVMGDNSPASQDSRLWNVPNVRKGNAKPGGPYLDRRLLIGKAVYVFWPHSWGGVPGVKPLPGFPGFSDMRLVR